MTAIICEYCSHETKYHSYNIDSFTGKKFDIYFCNKCLIAKTNLDKNFDLTHYYPKNYYYFSQATGPTAPENSKNHMKIILLNSPRKELHYQIKLII